MSRIPRRRIEVSKRLAVITYGCQMGAVLQAAALMILLAGCHGSSVELDQRVRRYFDIPQSQEVNAPSIRSAIIRHVPLGSSTDIIYAYLDQVGIGKDRLSSYYPVNDQGDIVCRIEFDPQSVELVKKSVGIILATNSEHKLKDIHVKEWLTGP